jgi:hypothetical protein
VIIGLSAAFTVCLTVIIQCWYDFSYNRNFKDMDDTYLYTIEMYGKSYSSMNMREPPVMKQAYSDIIDICAVQNWGHTDYLYADYLYFSIIQENGAETRYDDNARIGVTNSFLSIFNPKIIIGDATKLFTEPDRVIITASYAK